MSGEAKTHREDHASHSFRAVFQIVTASPAIIRHLTPQQPTCLFLKKYRRVVTFRQQNHIERSSQQHRE
jgi:hypothetical protein